MCGCYNCSFWHALINLQEYHKLLSSFGSQILGFWCLNLVNQTFWKYKLFNLIVRGSFSASRMIALWRVGRNRTNKSFMLREEEFSSYAKRRYDDESRHDILFSGKKIITYLTIVDMQHVWGASVNDLIAVSFDIKSPLGPIFNKDRHLSVVRIARGFHISATYNWTTRWSLNLSSGYPGKRSKHCNKACHMLHCPSYPAKVRARRSIQSCSISSSFSFQVKCLACLTQLLLNSNV